MSVEKCCNWYELFPFIPLNFVNLNITLTRNTAVVYISFKNVNFKNLTNILLVLTMFIQKADNFAKIIGTTIILTFANWEHKVQLFYAPFIMIDNVSHVSCLKKFPAE